MNVCGECGEDFSGVTAFDAHRVGKHAYTYSEGLRDVPPPGWESQNPGKEWGPRDDGRRCLSVPEMEASGFGVDRNRRWAILADVERARAHFRSAEEVEA